MCVEMYYCSLPSSSLPFLCIYHKIIQEYCFEIHISLFFFLHKTTTFVFGSFSSGQMSSISAQPNLPSTCWEIKKIKGEGSLPHRNLSCFRVLGGRGAGRGKEGDCDCVNPQ